MKEFLSRTLPPPVKRALSPLYRAARRGAGRLRAFARRKRRQHREGFARLRRGVRITGSEWSARLRGEPVARRPLVASRRPGRRVPRRLAAEVNRLRSEVTGLQRLLRRAAEGSADPHEQWYEQRLRVAGRLPGRDLAYFPGGAQNPYLRLLYAGCAEAGFEPRPLQRYDHLERLPRSGVFHLHWTRVFQVGAGSEGEAAAQSDAYLGRIERFLGRGGRLVWSVHEALPHDCEFPEVEKGLRRRLGELAAAVHVLHASTPGEVAGWYPLDPGKVFVVEHPLYRGAYADYVTRGAARAMLGVGEDEVVLLGFGAIRPYKGFDRLVGVLPRLREETGLPIRVMLAGPSYRTVENRDLIDLVDRTPGARIVDGAVPDEYVQVLFRAADVVVLPYRQVMNSGVLMLALTFGCPSVAPENPVTRDAVASGLVHLFDRESDEDLVRAVGEAVARRHRRGPVPDDFAGRYDPGELADRFASEVGDRLPPAPGPGPTLETP